MRESCMSGSVRGGVERSTPLLDPTTALALRLAIGWWGRTAKPSVEPSKRAGISQTPTAKRQLVPAPSRGGYHNILKTAAETGAPLDFSCMHISRFLRRRGKVPVCGADPNASLPS